MSALLAALFIATAASAQWTLLNSASTADFRGIDNVGNGTVWVSGTQGTILRSTDNGAHWQHCVTPPGADKLDFRAIQAFDANTALAMSSGPGDQSRLYKTADGCKTWKLLFRNPDKNGFWDAFLVNRFGTDGYLLGDPVDGVFRYWESGDKGETWQDRWQDEYRKWKLWKGLDALPGEGAFAASNSSLLVDERYAVGFATGGPTGARLLLSDDPSDASKFHPVTLPLLSGSPTSGAYSIQSRDYDGLVVVGGDYNRPNESAHTAAYSRDGGEHWTISKTAPHGYRSAVAYDPTNKTWITVGPNGTDISTDDGRNWRALKPASNETPDADKNWNALSLPFAAGPHGRIGILNPSALKPQQKH